MRPHPIPLVMDDCALLRPARRTAHDRLGLSQFPCYTGYVDKNLTLTLDESLLRAARKVALDRSTSVNQLVREFLASLVRETDRQQAALSRLDQIFLTTRIQVGRRTWKREDLHER